MALFRVSNERAQFDAAGNDASDQYGAGIRFTQGGNARITTGSPTNYNQGIPMSSTGQVAIVDATAGLPAGTIFHNGLPISGDKVCVSRNATAVVSNGTPYDSAGAVAADINLDLNFIGTDTLNSSVTFTRASSATFVGSNGLIQTTPQSKNLLLWTEAFDQGSWGKTTVTVTPNVATAPDGTTTADQVVFDTSNLSRIQQPLVIGSATYTMSIWARSPSGSFDIRFGEASTLQVFTITESWQRITFSITQANPNITVRNVDAGGARTLLLWGAQLEVGSTATSYTRNDGGLFPPRFDYDPVTLAAKGLLIEEQRTNLLLNSETVTSWGNGFNSTVQADATASPDGASTADKLVEGASVGAEPRYEFSLTLSASTTYTLSVFAKRSERSRLKFFAFNDNSVFSNQSVTFDLLAGSVLSATAGTVAVIRDFGNGWYRCSWTLASNAFGTTALGYLSINIVDYVAGGGGGLFLWGRQIEAGSFATSYIPTVASQVTRSADVASVNTLIPWYNATEGTLYAEALTIKPTASGSAIVVEVNDTTLANRNIIFYNSAVIQVRTTVNNVTQVDINQAYTPNQIDKLAYAIKTNDFAFARNGAIVGIDAIGVVPTVSRMDIAGNTGSANLNGHIRRITYYPRRLSNAELQAITA